MNTKLVVLLLVATVMVSVQGLTLNYYFPYAQVFPLGNQTGQKIHIGAEGMCVMNGAAGVPVSCLPLAFPIAIFFSFRVLIYATLCNRDCSFCRTVKPTWKVLSTSSSLRPLSYPTLPEPSSPPFLWITQRSLRPAQVTSDS